MMYIGIDISKDYFDAAMGAGVRRFANTPSGHAAFIAGLAPEAHCVMEATGPYCYRLATALHEHQIAVSVVNPLSVKRFSQSQLRRAKTDVADARLLAVYGERFAPPRWQPSPASIACLQQLYACQRQLTAMRTMARNQQQAFAQMPVQDTVVRASQRRLLAIVEQQIAALETHAESLLQQDYADLYARLQSIKGIGAHAAGCLIAATNGFTTFHSAKQLASYIGICPQITQSGVSNPGTAHLCKVGDASMRKLLYLCSWSACRWNRACRELYNRLRAKGKPAMVALIAVANKLLCQVMAVVRTHELYRDDYQPKRLHRFA